MTRKKAIITGAASGIGKATALRFANEGYDILANDIQHNALYELVQSLPAGNHLFLEGSYADPAVMQQGELIIREKWETVDVLINCAGVFQRTGINPIDLVEWRQLFDLMINGSLLATALALKFMPTNGRIIHITSIHANRAEAFAGAYSMSKSAIDQLCRTLAVELAERNILVNAIAPGFVDTPMSVVDGVNELESDWFRKNYLEGHHLPLKRPASPEEIAGVALFLAGKDASYITGQVITVDGGLTITF